MSYRRIPWYDWLLYRLFRWRWNPIFNRNPLMVEYMAIRFAEWYQELKADEEAE